MSEPGGVTHRTFDFDSLDGARLVGDLAVPEVVRGASVVCHPHPRHGGTRFDQVVSALHRCLPEAGVATLRFDFRSKFGDGVGERLDALAAIDELEALATEAPIAATGYSFGAWIALGLGDDRVTAVVAIAPPLAAMSAAPIPAVPTLVLTPAHDQFSPPGATEAIVDDWRARSDSPIDFEVIEMADHFLHGRTTAVAERVASWLSGRWRLPSPL